MKTLNLTALVRSVWLAIALLILNSCGGHGYGGGGSNSGGAVVTYSVGGTISGLTSAGLVIQNNTEQLTIAAGATSFTFPTRLANGAAFSVSVTTQPTVPRQICRVTTPDGTVHGANVTSIVINCITPTNTPTFLVGGPIVGLTASGLVIQNNTELLTIPAGATSYSFPTGLTNSDAFNVSIVTQPSGQTCSITNASGTIQGQDAIVVIRCAGDGGGGGNPPSFTVGGTLTGLFGTGLVLKLNGGNDLTIAANGSFVFSSRLNTGTQYNVTVSTAPSAPTQVCSLTNGSGVVATDNINAVNVSCGPIALLAGALGGSGSADGDHAAARFRAPVGIAVDSAGNMYVADDENDTIRKITPDGIVSTFAGKAGDANNIGGERGSADGDRLTEARFFQPRGVAFDPTTGNVYVADTSNNAIRKITPDGVVSTIAGNAGISGRQNGAGTQASFNFPMGIVADSQGNLYVADNGNNLIRKITFPGGIATVETLAGDSNDPAARFNQPFGVAVDSAGHVYVADTVNDRICLIDQTDPARPVTTIAGQAGQAGSTDATGSDARFIFPKGVATDSAGNLYVTDEGNATIRKIDSNRAVSTFAGQATQRGIADGTAGDARFSDPVGITTDPAGNLYVTETSSNTVRKITPDRVVSTFAGQAAAPGSTDGSGPTARFAAPFGVAADSAGDVYVADSFNNTIRKITPDGTVNTIAGNANEPRGSQDGSGADARFFSPRGIAIDPTGNVYVADSNNHVIREITPDGMVHTIVGFNFPKGVATDLNGNVYVADTGDDMIRKITFPNGVATVEAFAGQAGQADFRDGVGSDARFSGPIGVATDGAGNVYVADTGSHVIRKISPDATVITIAGQPRSSGSNDGDRVTARFDQPSGITVDSAGNVYVADTFNCAIRKIVIAGSDSTTTTVVGSAGIPGGGFGPLPGFLNLPQGITTLPGTPLRLVVTTENAILEIQLP